MTGPRRHLRTPPARGSRGRRTQGASNARALPLNDLHPETLGSEVEALWPSPEDWHNYHHEAGGAFASCAYCHRTRNTCRRSVRYDSREDAEEAAEAVNECAARRTPVVPSRCQWCGQWHLMATYGYGVAT